MELPPPRSAGNGYPAFKWNDIGDALTGTITSTGQIVERPDLNDTTKMDEQLVFEVHTDESVRCRNQRGEWTEGSEWTVWVRTTGQQYRVLYEAVMKEKGKIVEGARVSIKLTGFEDVKRPQPMKVFEVAFKPAPSAAGASAGSSVADLL